MQLKQEQRIKIDVYLREEKTITEISEILGYSYQTILREINNRSILVYNSKVIKHIKIKEEHICTLLENSLKYVINVLNLKEILVIMILHCI